MSNRELAKILIDQVPENKLFNVVSYLQGAVLPDEPNPNKPNEDTLAAMAEVQKMIDCGTGEHFTGSTQDFLAALLED